ncbi:OmpP1/FadL family transporter [Myroides sp. LJL119]
MNKYLIALLSTCSLITTMHAQEMTPSQVMRYNHSDLNGTARFKAMGGAFGAVGADLSSIRINPAGSAIANFNTAAFSLSYTDKSNNSHYLDGNSKDNYNGIDLGQLGALFVFKSNDPQAFMSKFSIGVNYENTQNYRNNISFDGFGITNSLGDYFLQAANNNRVPISDISSSTITEGYGKAGYLGGLAAQQAFLGYQSGLISLVDGQNNQYQANYDQSQQYRQARFVSNGGSRGYFSVNFSAELAKKFYVGANINLHTVDFTQNSSAFQNAYLNDRKEFIRFDNYLYTYGNGFSFNLGAIGKITNNLRVGLAYESPTWYSLHDELSQGITTELYNQKSNAVYPNFVNIYERYKLKTPSSYTASIAYILFNRALISLDYTLKDYSNNTFSPKSDYLYEQMNYEIANQMKTTNEIRLGGEYKIKQLSLRAGYRYEQSPYKQIKYTGDLNSYSFGLGYDFGGSKLDLAYSHVSQNHKMSLVDMSLNNLYSQANIKTKENWINLTYSILF